MISIILLEILSVAALFYSLLLIFLYFAPVEFMALQYVWTVTVCLLYYFSYQRRGIYRVSALLFLAPLLFYRNQVALIFSLITVPLFILYLEVFIGRGNRQEFAANFIKMALIYVAVIYLRWVIQGVYEAVGLALPFILVYFLSSTVLIRSVRHVEAGMEISRLQRSNIKYLSFTSVVFLLTSFPQVQDYLLSLVKKIGYLLLWPLQLLLRVVEWLAELVGLLENKYPGEPWQPPEMPELPPGGEPPPLGPGEEGTPFGLPQYLLIALLVALAIFFLYKLIVRVGQRSYRGLDYVEEREYIKKEKRRKKSLRPSHLASGEAGEQVRRYYRKFLRKLSQRQVALSAADTSLDVQKKAEMVFPQVSPEIREIYLPCRYGEKEPDKAAADKMEKLCKEL